MTVHRGRGLSRRHGSAVRNALIGAGVSAGVLWWLTKPSSSSPAPALTTRQVAQLAKNVPTSHIVEAVRHVQAAGSCPTPPTNSGNAFPSDESLVSYGFCQGNTVLVSSSIYSEITSAIAAGEAAALQAGELAAGAVSLATLVGATSLASTIAIAAAVAVPILGAVVAIGFALTELGIGSCNISVPSASGGTESIDCSWYGGPAENNNPGWVPNALSWIQANPQEAVAMDVGTFIVQHQVLNGPDDPTWGPLYRMDLLFVPSLAQMPTAQQMLKQVQLPAAAAVIGAAPGLLYELTNIRPITTSITVPTLPGMPSTFTGTVQAAPLQIQFPALTQADMATLQGPDAIGAYAAVQDVAKAAAQNSANWPLDQTTFQTQYGLSSDDALTILQTYAAGHYTTSGVTDYGGSTGGSGGGTVNTPVATPASSGVARTAGIALGSAGVGLLVYHLYTGYSALSTLRSLGQDIKAGARRFGGAVKRETGKVESAVKRDVHKLGHRRSNPLDRSSATGGRLVAYRVRLEQDIVEFEGRTAVLYRNDVAVAAFRPSPFQKTKIRSGEGEMLVFSDQLEVM